MSCLSVILELSLVLKHLWAYRAMGCASSSTRRLQRPFSAASFTKKASGSNCTWSILARMIGWESSSTRCVIPVRRALRGTDHTTSRAGMYPSAMPLGLASSEHRPLGEAFLAVSVTWNIGINDSFKNLWVLHNNCYNLCSSRWTTTGECKRK